MAMHQRPIPQPLESRGTIELTYADRAALLDVYRTTLATVERLERLLNLPPSRPTRAERRTAERNESYER